MRTALVLFTRDLRVHDNPALAAAADEAERVLPLFVLDEGILDSPFAAPNRVGFLLESLADLRASLEELGAPLVVRHGDVVREVERLRREVDATAVFLSEDVSSYAQRRVERLRSAGVELRLLPGLTVAAPGELKPYRVFTPYYRRWLDVRLRAEVSAPRLSPVPDLDPGVLPEPPPGRSPTPAAGGERAALARLERWLEGGLARYDREHDAPAADATSRLSPYLHFGCLSPLALVRGLADRQEGAGFVRQLAWRDFYAQLLHTYPETVRVDLRPRGDRWNEDEEGLQAWKDGRTGYPIVDAGMRQLREEGWMHNRARLITASFLTKQLYVDWRLGAAHFFQLLLDGDVANNIGNWQWVAGTGVDTRPYRVYNPTLQARRHDPEGAYVRRYVPELRAIEGPAVHEPWKLAGSRLAPDYPPPLVDHAEAVARFRTARSRQRGASPQD